MLPTDDGLNFWRGLRVGIPISIIMWLSVILAVLWSCDAQARPRDYAYVDVTSIEWVDLTNQLISPDDYIHTETITICDDNIVRIVRWNGESWIGCESDFSVRADVIYFDAAETVWIKFNREEQVFEFSHPVKADLRILMNIPISGNWVDGSGRSFNMKDIVTRDELEDYCKCAPSSMWIINDANNEWSIEAP